MLDKFDCVKNEKKKPPPSKKKRIGMQNNFQKTQMARNLKERGLILVLVIGEMQIKSQWDSRMAKQINRQ